MFLKNLSKREKIAALGCIIFVMTAGAYNFVIEPVFRQWQTLHQERRAKTDMLRHDLRILASHRALKEDYQKIAKYLKPDKSEGEAVAEVLSYVESVSRNDSCLVTNIKPIGVKEFGAFKEILVDVSSEGDAASFSKFLYDIENTSEILLKVRRFSLNAKAGQQGALRGSFLISKIIIE